MASIHRAKPLTVSRHSPNAVAHAIREARPDLPSVQVNTGQVLVEYDTKHWIHVHPSSSVEDALDRIDSLLTAPF